MTEEYWHPSMGGGPLALTTIKLDGRTVPATLATRTANLLDSDPDAVVHWQCDNPAAAARADRASSILLHRRRAETTFVYTYPRDGLYRFHNTPRLFDPDAVA